VADVPLGAFLSGGIDSSLLVTLLAHSGKSPIKTFTVKFGEQSYDESAFARVVAHHVGSEHHELRLEKAEDGEALVGKVLDQFDQPFGDSSAIPTYLLSREIGRYVKVVIGGDGGDEMFGGYPRFAYADVARRLGRVPRFALGGARAALKGSGALSPERQRQVFRLIRAAMDDGAGRLTSLCSQVPTGEFSDMITFDFQKKLGDYRPTLAAVNGYRHLGGPELMDATIRATLPADYLRKVDVMSSAHGLEVRVPMLSNRVLDFSSKLATKWKYSRGKSKILLRRLAELRLPLEVARKRKQGFGIPLDSWLGIPGRVALREILEDSQSSLSDFIRPTYIKKLMGAFSSHQWDHSEWSRYGVYQRAYSLWGLHRWLDRWHTSL
jgi:asparagine synthase (glutamine-hydrolysing)